MYAVVGCNRCSNLWIVDGRPERTQCPRCGKSRQYAKLKKFVSTDDEDHAREVRASILANRQGEGETFAEMDSFGELTDRVEEAVVDDDEYLEASGIDASEVEAAGERAAAGSGGSRSRPEVVRDALRDLDDPTREAVAEYAEEHGVPGEKAGEILDRLARRGEVTESGGTYRLL